VPGTELQEMVKRICREPPKLEEDRAKVERRILANAVIHLAHELAKIYAKNSARAVDYRCLAGNALRRVKWWKNCVVCDQKIEEEKRKADKE